MTLGNDKFRLTSGDTVEIDKTQQHRIVNDCKSDLIFIEIQTGDIISESDIVRIVDKYGRFVSLNQK